MFDKVTIQNFRGIRNAEIEGLHQINVFFGKNNCGKSSVLEAIFLLTGQSNPMLPIRVNGFRNYTRFAENDLRLDFYNLKSENLIRLSATGERDRDLEISMFREDNHSVELYQVGKGATNAPEAVYGLKLSYTLNGNGIKYNSTVSVSQGDMSNGKIGLDSRYEEYLHAQYLPSAYMQIPIDEKFAKIVENKQDKIILKILNGIEPKIKNMTLVGKELMVDIGLDQLLPINVMGDGLRKLLAIVLAVYECKDGILLVDEVDNGFHYTAMPLLWKAIFTAADINHVQLFLSTHNIDFLRGLVSYIKEEGEEMKKRISAYRLLRMDNDEIIPLDYDYMKLSYSLEQDIEVR